VSHRKSSGKDHLWSNANFQRRADTHATRHIQATLDSLSKIVDRLCVDRVLLAGSVEARKELEHLLPKRLRGKLAGSIPLPVTSTVTQVIRAVQEIGSQAERRGEDELVSALVDSAGKQDRAVTGLQATIVALRESDVARLVVSGDFHPTWDDLPELEIWLRSDAPDRPDDLTESLVEKTLQRGGRVEVVWGKAASHLQKEGGGIGAFLRF
jgi:peptide subunit release factor 1 (eRF1)